MEKNLRRHPLQHAYLIMAHNEKKLLGTLLSMLDRPNNDIYLHLNIRTPFEADFELKHAKLHLVERQHVTWGGTAIMGIMLLLMEEATKTHHDYYHYISGSDLPIQTQEDTDRFFEENKGKEFLCMDYEAIESGNFLHRVKYYHLKPSENRKVQRVLDSLQTAYNALQKFVGIDRTKQCSMKFYKSDSWFDLSEDFVRYALDKMRNDPECIRAFRSTTICDEVFLPTLLMASPYKDNLCDKALHYIRWKEGNAHPETLDPSYLDDLKASDCLFARKFNSAVSGDLIDKVCELYG